MMSFRPHTGDYVFIDCPYRVQFDEQGNFIFPSPYWGLFFYRKTKHRLTSAFVTFPSPYWGLFFYHSDTMQFIKEVVNPFPSPYWGLFFYQSNEIFGMVS